MKLKTALFAATAMLAAAPAAQAYEGWYGAIGAGLSYMDNDLDTEGDGASVFDQDGDYDNGAGIYASFGYKWARGLRTELEYSYRNNDARHISGIRDRLPALNASNNNFSGGIDANTLMINALYDFDVNETFTPYLGAGVGGALLNGTFTSAGNPTLAVDDGGELQAAFQGIAGVAVSLAENLALDLSYRYFATTDASFEGTLNGAAQTIRSEYRNHSLMAGLRWNFGAAPAPAPQYKDCWDGSSVPVAANCPVQPTTTEVVIPDPINFTVYFDYDKANLTPEASNLIREAAGRALASDIDTVVVAGNTDTSGNAAYNQRLSQRRASVVRDALIANGVSADRIRTEANGENNLAKATPDGTREPLNRRSDVTISFE